MTEDVASAARSAGHHPVVEKGARLGYAMSGLIHLLIGWIGLKLAWGVDGRHSDGVTDGVKALGKTVMYAVFAFSAFRVTQRAGESSEETTDSLPHRS